MMTMLKRARVPWLALAAAFALTCAAGIALARGGAVDQFYDSNGL